MYWLLAMVEIESVGDIDYVELRILFCEQYYVL